MSFFKTPFLNKALDFLERLKLKESEWEKEFTWVRDKIKLNPMTNQSASNIYNLLIIETKNKKDKNKNFAAK